MLLGISQTFIDCEIVENYFINRLVGAQFARF